jgi:glycosyltransferase involved in cell wall biosynthesis
MDRDTAKSPKISVIMPVYNSEQYLSNAIESTLQQTFKNFELIIVDDNSTDNSYKIAKNYSHKDTRIVILQNLQNRGASFTANRAIMRAQSKYIARMDSDDIMYPNRLKSQYEFLCSHPDHILVGGQVRIIDENNKFKRYKRFPLENNKIRELIFTAAPVQQPTMMIDRSKLPPDFPWYCEEMNTAEDIDLFFKLMQYGKLANIKQIVLDYRIHKQNLSSQNPKETFKLTYKTRKRAIKQYDYKPSLKGRIICELQRIVITFIPTNLVYPIFFKIRDIFINTNLINSEGTKSE